MLHEGLTAQEAEARLEQYGPNALPEIRPPSLALLFLRQFLNPLIYILLLAAVVSLFLSDLKDAVFIGLVLLANGLIGTVQEYSANKAAAALKKLEQSRAAVLRDHLACEIDARDIVPGDIVLLEAGGRVPADLTLFECTDLQCDESLLTGESKPVKKTPEDRCVAGAMVTRGRGRGVVTATGANTSLGAIAGYVGKDSQTEPPLMIRMKHFTRNVAIAVMCAITVLIIIGVFKGMDRAELFAMAVGLAVSAIPEGLPVAISIALAIAMRRMANANVIVRQLPAVEALGSCTLIATDKTGTLTRNELTVTRLTLPDSTELTCETGYDIATGQIHGDANAHLRLSRLLHAASLPNEARLIQEEENWRGQGDTVDIALLAAAHKGGLKQHEVQEHYPLVSRIPYEPDLKYAASFHEASGGVRIFVKGAPESLIAMCNRMDIAGRAEAMNAAALIAQKEAMTSQGLRVLACAEGEIDTDVEGVYGHHHLVNLTFLGMAGMQDPVRPEVPQAIADAKRAGVHVVMITGDDPQTAAVIGQQAGLCDGACRVATGVDIKRAEAEGEAALDALTRQTQIYARVEPAQKLAIVLSLARNGHFVAVTGDGVNDAPALKHAHVGVAMGLKGTDVAKESASIILTDDHFASIVAGIREGRVAYNNIRKVIFMLASTGAAEVVLFLLAMLMGTPMPLFAVQLLWLNLVTNGVQDVALACEKAEGDELSYPPRKPREPIFDRIMLRRIFHSTLVMGVGGFMIFWGLLSHGYTEEQARNLLLLLFVLFENVQTFNSRSERHSVFRQSLFANPFLVLGVLGAQGLHIAAMHIPAVAAALRIAPVSWMEWSWLLLAATLLLVVMELEKYWDQRRVKR